LLQARDDGIAITRNLISGSKGAFLRWYVGELHRVFDTVDRGFEECLADAKHVVAHEPDRAVTIVDHALVQAFIRHLAHVALHRAQYGNPFFDQLFGRQRLMPGAVEADELSDLLEVLPEHELLTFGDNRHIAHAEGEQFFAPARVVQYVDRDEIDAFFRKKLFRSEAAASPRLGEQREFFSGCIHRSQ